VEISTLTDGQSPRGSVLQPADRAAVLGYKNTEQALYVKITEGAEVTEPVRITITGTQAGARANSHIVLETEPNAKAVFVIDHRGSADFNGNLEVKVGEGSTVNVVSLQRWNDDAVHVGQHDAEVGKDASYKH